MDPETDYCLLSVKQVVKEVRENFKITKVDKTQTRFGYFQVSKMDKEHMKQIHDYIRTRLDDMLQSEYVSITEFLDMYSCWNDNVLPEDLLVTMQQIYKEKQFIDDFIEIYELHGSYMICPDRYTIRTSLEEMRFTDYYLPDYLHALVNYGFITKEELFEFLPKAREVFDK